MEQHSFQEVMRQLNRLCSHYPNCGNNGCPLFDECGNIGTYSSNKKQAMRIEKTVMQWAAEHPESVYPTWLELAVQQGFKIEEGKQCTDEEQLLILLMASVNTPIPADIAQKLGIEPKEVDK